ncbi:MAG: hypothetical protein AAF804_05550 [Bacteroidota bacterium]
MRQALLGAMALLFFSSAFAQIQTDLLVGSSKADNSFVTLRASGMVSEGIRLGASYQFSNYRYRFVDARPVSDGVAHTLRFILVGRLAESNLLRLDGFLQPGFRLLTIDPSVVQDFSYDFQAGQAIILEPGLVVTLKASDRLNFHTGVNTHMAFQTSPEALFEQFPSAQILAGASYRVTERWAVFSSTQTGPMAGAMGDSEKFFWQLALGLRYSLSPLSSSTQIFGF